MKEARLRELLRQAPVPVGSDAERRGLAVVEAAFAERAATRRTERPKTLLPRLALAPVLAVIVAVVAAALVLSPAGASVRDWVDDVLTTATPRPEPGLAQIPGGGRLLVQSEAGPWVVGPDGSRRLLGDYREATWSPRGLFVAVASGRTLSAVEPDGTARWALDAEATVADPRWSPSGFRIAYRSGHELRVTAADGTGEHRIAPRVRPVPPAWAPSGLPQIAYIDAGGQLRIADSESGRILGSAASIPGSFLLEWGSSGGLLEASPTTLVIHPTRLDKMTQTLVSLPRQTVPLPAGSRLRDAALSPSGKWVAALLEIARPSRRSVVLLRPLGGGPARRLLSLPGRLDQLAFSPPGDRLLVTWPAANQWLFLPLGRGRVRSFAAIGTAFAPGERVAPFPAIEGWCCSRAR